MQTNPPQDVPETSLIQGASHWQLARRIEEASLNAWPALQQTFLDGWILRFAKGFTKRANSIVPLYPSSQSLAAGDLPEKLSKEARASLEEKIRYCENLYAREQLQTIFRIPYLYTDLANDAADNPALSRDPNSVYLDQLDDLLAQRSYQRIETSLVLSKPLHTPTQPHAGCKFLPLDEWLGVYAELTEMPEPAQALHGLILNGIAGDCGYGVLSIDGKPVACGLAVVERELVGLFDIYTHRDARRLGYGMGMVNGLLDWAQQHGAQRAYLQMVAENAPAAALYKQLNFAEIYRYWYRVGT